MIEWENTIVNAGDKTIIVKTLNFINLFFAQVYKQEDRTFGNPDLKFIKYTANVYGSDKSKATFRSFKEEDEALIWAEKQIKNYCEQIYELSRCSLEEYFNHKDIARIEKEFEKNTSGLVHVSAGFNKPDHHM